MKHAIAAIAVLCARTAVASPESDAAERLLAEGIAMAETGDYTTACTRFAAARQLRDDIRAQGLEAGCAEKLDHLATAARGYEHLRALATAAHDDDNAAFAAAGSARVAARLPHLEIHVATATASMLVTVDGHVLDRDAWRGPVALDAGRHDLHIESPGSAGSTAAVDLVDGQTARAWLVAPVPARRRRSPFGLAALATGGVAIAIGGAFGGAALSAWHDARDAGCDPHGVCPTAPARQQLVTATHRGDVATWTIGAGAAIAIAGLAAVLVAPRTEPRGWTISPTITPDFAGVSWTGTTP